MAMEYGALSAFRGELKASAARAPAAAGLAVTEAGNAVAEAARGFAPVLTGELRASIHWVRTGVASGEVRADSDHAEYVENGTSVMAPEPYMAPAADAHEDELPTLLLDAVLKGL